MVPAGDNAEYIKLTYGDVQMSSQGFVIFDDYTIARVELDDLTGNSGSDIAKANKAHHGTVVYNVDGYTWHHHQNAGILQLVDEEIHAKTWHHGGYSIWGSK